MEDPRLVTGRGRYVDDIRIEGTVHAVFVRSIEAHARLTRIDRDHAASMPGVIGVFTSDDLGLTRPMPDIHPSPLIDNSFQACPLAMGEVCYVGEPVAVVVAETPYQAVDAAAAVVVHYEPLRAVVDHRAALEEDAPVAHVAAQDNLVCTLRTAYGDIDAAFAMADLTIGVRLSQHRGACVSMETRGVLAVDDQDRGGLAVWSSTQAPHALQRWLAEYFGVAPETIRVVAPDVGGGFGPKAAIYAEEYVVTALARTLGRPVKWIESRREHFTTTHQQRDQSYDLEVACAADGTLRGLRGTVIHDNGAYVPYGVMLPLTGLDLLPGPYVLPAMDVRVAVVYTNLTPTSPIRGAGRPNAVFAMERVMDAVARTVGIDPSEVRRRNFVPRDGFPYELPFRWRSGNVMHYDSGDYHGALDHALAAADHAGFAARRESAGERGMLRGFGVASYVEDTGLGPHESARVEVRPDGTVAVDIGTGAQGQGHATVLAQLVASELGIEIADVVVRAGDTGTYATGVATVASRTAATAGSSVHLAAAELAAEARLRAARRLEAAEADLVLAGGVVGVVGQPGAEVPLGDLVEDGLVAEASVPVTAPTFAFGTHVAEVEVDPDTGHVAVVGYTVAHDCGRIINPMIVDGQIHGGLTMGLAPSLFEEIVYDENGSMLTGTFMDYLLPTSMETPAWELDNTVTPSPHHPFGAKGVGESPTVGAPPAIANAVVDALSHLGVRHVDIPMTPQKIYAILQEKGVAE